MPTVRSNFAKTSQSRVFVTEGPAGPTEAPVYRVEAKGMAVSQPFGDVEPRRRPSRTRYDAFDIIGTIKGQRGLPTTAIETYYQLTYSDLLAFSKRECEGVVAFHFGSCGTPDDHNGGWSDGKVLMFTGANITEWGIGDPGALDSDERDTIAETLQVTAQDFYEIKPLVPQTQADSEITDEVIDVLVCDAISCGACGISSDGAQVMFALINDNSGSPGLPAEVVYTEDGGSTWASSAITSLGLAESPSAFACMGAYLVVVSNASGSHHYIAINDLLDGLGGWTEVTTGYVGAPNAIHSVNASTAYVVGDSGYVYKITDPTQAVTVLDAGSATTENLQAVHALDADVFVAVGANNAVIYTDNGGTSFSAITGPSAGVTLNAIFMASQQRWWIGTNGGLLYYTLDTGSSWTQKTFQQPVAAATITDIVFVTREVGYFTYNDTGALRGYVYRTIDGGYTWYRLPEGTLSWPTVRSHSSLAVPDAEARENILLVGGLSTDANDGVLVKAA